MLHDPSFVAAVYADPARALAGLSIRPSEWAWLVRSDAKAWVADPDRPSRVFEAIRREFTVSCAIAELVTGSRAEMLRFFSSSNFHESVQNRRVLPLDFGGWLLQQAREGGFGRRTTASLAELELACARVRRGPCRLTPPQDLTPVIRASPWIELLRLPEGTLQLFEQIRALLVAGSPIPRSRLQARTLEWVLVEAGTDPGSLNLGPCPEGMAGLIRAAGDGLAREALQLQAVELGASVDEAPEVLAAMLADGLLTASTEKETD